MSVEQAADLVRDLMRENDMLETREMCEDAADSLTQAINTALPNHLVHRLVYKDSATQKILHHALLVVDPNRRKLLVNTVATNLFPQYIGPPEDAPSPHFRSMQVLCFDGN
ncbi:MAG: hypothetical protein AAB874_05085 [Patescibacteria group bacterium]